MNSGYNSPGPQLDGIVVIDKPAGWTSHDVVARIRGIFRTRRVGHTGTLDPFATGVLVVCLNQATRLVRFLTGDDKEYEAVMRLGFSTDTGDLTGKPSGPVVDASSVTESDLRMALEGFKGRISQIPPMYSAKKVGGVKLYELARRGEEIERSPVDVQIHEIELLGGPEPDSSAETTRKVTFRVLCSSGTYIRTLAEDIGRLLETGAHLIELRRTRAGKCSLKQAVTIDELERLAKDGRLADAIIGMPDSLDMQQVEISEAEANDIRHGRPIHSVERIEHQKTAKLCDSSGRLLAIAEFDPQEKLWRPRTVFS